MMFRSSAARIGTRFRQREDSAKLRLILCGVIALILTAGLIIPAVRDFLIATRLGFLASLTLVVVAILPARFYLFAPFLAGLANLALRFAHWLKIKLLGLPITYLDILGVVQDPHAFLLATGTRGPALILFYIVAAIALLFGLYLAVRKLRRTTPARLGFKGALLFGALGLGFAFAQSVAREANANLEQVNPAALANMWEPNGQNELMKTIGPVAYVLFTRLAGDQQVAAMEQRTASPLPQDEIAAASAKYLPEKPVSQLPNIVFYHAESTFDPNQIFDLDRSVDLPIWTAADDTQLLGPLQVNIIGGGSWVSEFEVLTGVNPLIFGYHGFYSHMELGAKVERGLPTYLRAKGYETRAYYSETAKYFGVGKAFARYGIDTFRDRDALGLSDDWSNSDMQIARAAITDGAFAQGGNPLFLFVSSEANHGPHPCRNFGSADNFVTRFPGNSSFAENCLLNEYILRARRTSEAADLILEQLRGLERETGRPFVLLIYGDHQPWSFADGQYSVAGTIGQMEATVPVGRFRKSDNSKTTFFHLMASDGEGVANEFPRKVPISLLPTIASAYTRRPGEPLYFPVNMLAYDKCGSDWHSANCELSDPLALWSRDWLFKAE